MTMTPTAASAISTIHGVASAASSAVHGAAAVVAPAPGWVESGSLSFEMAKGLPAAFVTLVIGWIAATIARRQLIVAAEQKRVATAKLNLDLFDRRLKIFEATEQFLMNSFPGAPQDKTDFINLFAEASFLFESEVEAYMKLALKNRVDLVTIGLRAAGNQGMVRPEDIARDTELVQWFSDEHGGGCRLVFAPYLDFSEWR